MHKCLWLVGSCLLHRMVGMCWICFTSLCTCRCLLCVGKPCVLAACAWEELVGQNGTLLWQYIQYMWTATLLKMKRHQQILFTFWLCPSLSRYWTDFFNTLSDVIREKANPFWYGSFITLPPRAQKWYHCLFKLIGQTSNIDQMEISDTFLSYPLDKR